MVNVALLTTIGKGVAAFWSLILLAISGATISRWNKLFESVTGLSGGFNQGNAVVAASVFDLIYFTAALVFLFKFPESILVSVLVDVCIMGYLFIFTLGAVAALTDVNTVFDASFCGASSFCGLGRATLGFGWILVFGILALIILEVVLTLKNFGGSLDVWKTPFNELMTNGSPVSVRGSTGISSGGIGMTQNHAGGGQVHQSV